MPYDPEVTPDPNDWLAMPEPDRHEAVQRYHTRTNFQGESLKMHAAIHVVIENQLADGHPAATAAMGRLLTEGLDRHDAIHAIGDVLSREMYAVMTEKRLHDPDLYARDLNQLTAVAWLASWQK